MRLEFGDRERLDQSLQNAIPQLLILIVPQRGLQLPEFATVVLVELTVEADPHA